MTCIVGIAQQGKVWLGADSAGTADDFSQMVRVDRKVFHNGPYIMGFTGSYRMGQLLAYSLTPPTCSEEDDVMEFMCTRFIDDVRQCLKDGGFARIKDEEEEGGTFLVGYRQHLFRIDDDYHVGESIHGFDAVGCGELIAIGSLYSTTGRKPKNRIQVALEAASNFSAGVRGPFHIEDN